MSEQEFKCNYETLAKFTCDFESWNNKLTVYDNSGQISVWCASDYEGIEVYLSAEDEEKLRVLLNKRKESKE